MTTLLLAGLALLFAGPVPLVLSAQARLRLTPVAAMVLWQSLALAAVLAALGAGLSLATWTGLAQGRTWPDVLLALIALALTATVAGRMALTGHRVGTELRAQRRRHRELLDVLSDEHAGMRVLEHSAPTAYCLPGLRSSRVVVSRGALESLDESGLQAVLEHERAHLRSRHDLVVEAFTVLHRAFPAAISTRRALGEVALLVEVLADRAAVRRVGRGPLIRALAAVAGGGTPQATLAVGGNGIQARLEVLRETRDRRVQSGLLIGVSAAVVVLPTVLVALPWLRSLGV